MSEDFEGAGPEPITLGGARDLMISYARNSLERLSAISAQDGEIYDWAEDNGFEIVGYARDNRVDGSLPAMERPGLSAAIKAVEDGQVAGIIVQCFDRLARDFPTQDDALQRIWAAGGRFFTKEPEQEWKPDRPGDAQFMSRLGYARMAEDERRALLARLQRGRRQKIARGGYGGGHRIRRRYGVERVQIQGRWEYRPIPEEQAVIRLIQDLLRIEAAPQGTTIKCVPPSYANIARFLDEHGYPTVDGGPWGRKFVRDLAMRGPDRLGVVPLETPIAQPLEWVRRMAS